MSISSLSLSVSPTVVRTPTPPVATPPAVSKTFTGPRGGTLDVSVSKSVDGTVSVQADGSGAKGASVSYSGSLSADGAYTGSATASGPNGDSFSSSGSGTVSDGAVTYSRSSQYAVSGGPSGTRTISDTGSSADGGSLDRSVDGSGTSAAAEPYARSSSLHVDPTTVSLQYTLTLGTQSTSGGGSGTPPVGIDQTA